jgi:hypothetical protein
MKTEIADLWIAALRSGKYQQTKDVLNDGIGMCCLGVLCDLHAQAHPDSPGWDNGNYLDEEENLPQAVAEWAGMALGDDPGTLFLPVMHKGEPYTHLAKLNDNGMTFPEIAAVIEERKGSL